jgi:sigma-B regulation protein RsbU (phosphoserine phosphatase)
LRAGKIIAASLLLTLAVCALAFFSRAISDFIYYNHTVILSVAVVVLCVALLAQYKHTAVLRENARLYRELQVRQAHIDRDMSMARNVQQGLLKQKIPRLKGCKICAACRPAEKIGGDFYGVQLKNSRAHFFLGDVAGHGISSALVMALTRGLLQELINQLDDPARILAALNNSLNDYIHDTPSFVALFYGCYDPRARKLTYITAGQNPALLFCGGVLADRLQTGGSILGMFAGQKFPAKNLKLQKGDRLICYTDGFTEARAASGAELGEDFIIDALQKIIDKPLDKIKTGLYASLDRAAKTINDDLSLLCFEA